MAPLRFPFAYYMKNPTQDEKILEGGDPVKFPFVEITLGLLI